MEHLLSVVKQFISGLANLNSGFGKKSEWGEIKHKVSCPHESFRVEMLSNKNAVTNKTKSRVKFQMR